MRRVRLALGTAAISSAFAACSLFTSLDGLQGGGDSGAGSSDASNSDATAVDAAGDASATDASSDAGSGLLSCNAPDLVAYWPMDEGSGSTVHDCHQGLDGVFGDAGSVTWGSRDGGANIELASAGFVFLGSPSQLQVAGPFTVAGFYRTDMVPVSYTSLFWNFSNPTGFEITEDPSGALFAQLGTGDFDLITAYPMPPIGTWQHLAAVYEPGVRLELYVNGTSVGSLTTLPDGGPLPNEGVAPDTTHEVRFGANYSFSSWTGAVDDIRVFSRALTPGEIAALAKN